ncbi:MAG: hypothetical protein WHW07_10005 [Bacteroidales bacterium]|jgi:tetratricopeptide (TPR) repeat protein
MKKLLLFIVLTCIILSGFAQVVGGVHSKLAKYYKNQQWEDCAFKADRMILKPKYEKDAEVYLYLAASYNKIFLMCLEDTTLLYKVPDYVNAYVYALKYSQKSLKLDKKAKKYFPKNDFLLEEIAISGIHYIDHYISINKIPKAVSYLRKIQRTYTDENLNFMLGVLSAKINDNQTANQLIKEYFSIIRENKTVKNTDFIAIDAFDIFVNHLISQEPPLIDSAKNVITLAKKTFPNDELIAYLEKVVSDPEIKLSKPENAKKTGILKHVKINTSSGDEEDYDEDKDE